MPMDDILISLKKTQVSNTPKFKWSIYSELSISLSIKLQEKNGECILLEKVDHWLSYEESRNIATSQLF